MYLMYWSFICSFQAFNNFTLHLLAISMDYSTEQSEYWKVELNQCKLHKYV